MKSGDIYTLDKNTKVWYNYSVLMMREAGWYLESLIFPLPIPAGRNNRL